MKRSAILLLTYLVPLLSLAAFAGSGWLWHRSVHMIDYVYRVTPAPNGTALRGYGSCRGALLIGSIVDSIPREPNPRYRHEMIPLTSGGKGGGGAVLTFRPQYKTGGLGFGVSHGELAVNLPMAFLLPKRIYHVVYVPYYFIMLVAMAPWVMMFQKLFRRDSSRKAKAASKRAPPRVAANRDIAECLVRS